MCSSARHVLRCDVGYLHAENASPLTISDHAGKYRGNVVNIVDKTEVQKNAGNV